MAGPLRPSRVGLSLLVGTTGQPRLPGRQSVKEFRQCGENLKELEAEGLVVRTVVPTTPAHAIYALSARGEELVVALQPLVKWGVAAGR